MKTLANHIARLVSAATLSLLFAGTLSQTAWAQSAPKNDSHSGHAHQGQHQGHADSATQSKIQDGVQIVEINVGNKGYTPQRIALKANVPVRLVFTRTEQAGCADQVQIPAFGIKNTDLPLNKPVTIAFTPKEGGEFTFSCGMSMVKGAIMVKS